MLETRVLNYFLAVAREGSFTAAAHALHVTQPTLSRQMMDLEAELGQTLFVRGSHHVVLTPEGMLLRKRASEILELVGKTESEFSSMGETVAGDVYIGSGETDVMNRIAEVIHGINNDYPDVRFHIFSGNAEAVMERLDKGMLDFGVLIQPVDIRKYNALSLPEKDVWGVAMRRDCPLAKKKRLTKDDLLDYPLIFSRHVEQSIFRLTQKGHDVGIHLVMMTSALRKDVVTDHIKSNVRSKIVLRVSDVMSSRVIMDRVGAEKLLGNGDMLFFSSQAASPERIQGAYVSDQEIQRVIDEIAAQRPQTFDDGIFALTDEEDEEEYIKGRRSKGRASKGGYDDELDDYDEADCMANSDIIMAAADKYLEPTDPPIMVRALEIIINEQQVSTSYLQRRLGIGYNKAADILDKLEQRHVISAPLPGGQKRTILILDDLRPS